MKRGGRVVSAQGFRNSLEPTWCPGCAYYGVLSALTEALSATGADPGATTFVSGIGCSSRLPLWLSTFGMHTLHGRAVPVAVGARLARPDVAVIVTAGDGDLFSIGVGHFVHAARRNVGMTVICLNNRMYAMTRNQASPTSARGYRGSLTPEGKLSPPLNTLELAILSGATLVGRTFAGDRVHLRKTFAAALTHRGFSFVDVIAPCRSFDAGRGTAFLRDRVRDVQDERGFDPSDRGAALTRAADAYRFDTDESSPVAVGIFHRQTGVPVYEERAGGGGKRRLARDVIARILDKCDPGRRAVS